MDKKIPNLFIVGMQKSGTESLKMWLNQHPEIWMNTKIEPNYFSNDVQGSEDSKGLKGYLSLFPKSPKQKYVGEKSARYFCSWEAAKRIKNFNPPSKIIIILRNPAEMMFSLHTHLRQQGLESIKNFEEALEKEEERRKKYGTKFVRHFLYKFIAEYSPKVKRFIKEFGKKNVKVILLDDVKKEPQKVYNELTDFLGIKRFKPEFKILNISRRQPKSEFHAKSFYFIQNLSLPLKKLIKLFSSPRLREKIKKLHLKEMAQKDKINPGLKHKINTSMKKDIKKLEKIIKKDLSQWLK